MIKTIRLLLPVFVTILLSGCLVPEKFDTSVTVKPDGGYTFKYTGTAVNAAIASSIKEGRQLSKSDEAKLKRDAEQSRSLPGVQSISYKGNGRYEMRLQQDMKPGEQITTALKIFRVTKDSEGVLSVSGIVPSASDRNQLRSIGVKIDGKAEVFLPANAKVIDHNAKSTPGFFSKSYRWTISGMDQQPFIRFTLN